VEKNAGPSTSWRKTIFGTTLALALLLLLALPGCGASSQDAANWQRNPERLVFDFNNHLSQAAEGIEASFDPLVYQGLVAESDADGLTASLTGTGVEGVAGAEVSYSIIIRTDAEQQVISATVESNSYYAAEICLSLAQSFDLQLDTDDLDSIRQGLHIDDGKGQADKKQTFKLHGLKYSYTPSAAGFRFSIETS